ncbi:hypothetical protein N2152v2_007664 [Parachlorella kessleri]
MAGEDDMQVDGEQQEGQEDSSSDSESDLDAADVSEEDSRRIMELEAALQENPNQYDTHVQYLEVLRRCGMKERLREARHAMAALFPLSESLWLDWVGDELEGLAGEEDIPRIARLLEASVGDYLSINLWLQYLGFVKELDPEVSGRTPQGLAKMRDLFERALTAGGLHVAEGSRLWEAFRSFEEDLLEESPSQEQAEKVRALFHRQLGVPLADGADTLAAFKAWEQTQQGAETAQFEVPAHVLSSYKKAQKLVDLRKPYEEAVGPGHAVDAELLAAYMAYIKAEEAHGEPARVQIMFERAMAVFPVTHYLWQQYARYLEAHLKIPAIIQQTYQRAVRNCPWVGELWCRYLRALERAGAVDEQHALIFQEALAAGLQYIPIPFMPGYEDLLGVYLARLDFLRRQGDAERLRSTFQEASKRLQAAFPEALDRTLTQYWADCEAAAGDMAAARSVWEAALKSVAGRYADCWQAYIELERRLGNAREARGLYKRCYSRRLEEGGQAVLCEAWLRFERELGSEEDHFGACLKVEPILAEAQAQQAAAAMEAPAAAEARAAAAKAPKLSKEEMKKLRQERDPNFGKKAAKKREAPAREADHQQQQRGQRLPPPQQAQQDEGLQDGGMQPPPPKKPRTTAPATAGQQQLQQQQGVPQQDQPPVAAPAGQPAGMAKATGAAGAEQEQAQPAAGAAQQEPPAPKATVSAEWLRKTGPSTVFVKHLAEEVGEGELEALFAPCGRITALQLGRDRDGRPRGFAYVEFSSEEEMRRACEMSGREVRGKHILVAHSQPPAAAGGRGGRGGARSGGDFRGGRGGRGARGRFDPSGRGGRGDYGPNPHQRAHIDLGASGPAQAAGDGNQGGGRKPALGFLPRSAALTRPGAGGGAGTAGGGRGSGGGGEGGGPPKSNAEFRKMMLGGKKAKGKHRLDKYYNLAKEQGYRSRAAFKLIQLNRKYNFLSNARALLDLCAAPGGWCQVAAKNMPVSSLIIGVDLDPIKPIRGVKTIVGDITTQKCRQIIKKESGGSLMDVVLCDGAPNVGGAWSSEAYTQSWLVLEALRMASDTLAPRGTFVTKVFRSKDYSALLYAMNQLFDKVEATKPAASRNASAEIFVVCLGYKAPAKIDPRLLDPKYIFQEVAEAPKLMGPDALLKQKVAQKRFREGYDEGASSTHRALAAAAFVAGDAPVELLGRFTQLVLEGPASLPPSSEAGVGAVPAAAAKLIREHPATTAEVRTLCRDLQVLGRSEFKQLLKWRLLVKKDLQQLLAKQAGAEGSDSDAGSEGEEGAGGREEGEEEDPEEKLLREMGEIKDRLERRRKKERRRRREAKVKSKLRAAQLAETEGIATEEGGPEALFSLAGIKGKGGVDGVADASDAELASSSEAEEGGGPGGESDIDSEEEQRRYDAMMDAYLEESYSSFKQRQGQKTDTAKKRRRRLGAGGDLSDEEEQGELELPQGGRSSDDEGEAEEAGGGLIVSLDERRAGVPASAEAAAAQWFSQDLFDDENLMADDGDEEQQQQQQQKQAKQQQLKKGAKAVQQKAAERRQRPGGSLAAPAAEASQPPDSGGEGTGAAAGDEAAAAATAAPAGRRSGDEDSLDSEQENGAANGAAGGEPASSDDEDAVPLRSKRKARDAAGAGVGIGGGTAGTEDGGFEVVPARDSDASSDSGDSADEFENLDDSAKAEMLALAKKMLRRKVKDDIVEAAYNRFAFHDTNLPRWFAEDERKFMRPAPHISGQEYRDAMEELRAIDARPIKKVAEAKARKRKRMLGPVEGGQAALCQQGFQLGTEEETKLTQARQKAEAIANQEDVPMKSKMREIEKLYAQARGSGKKEGKKLSRRGAEQAQRKGPALDKRMRKDKRGADKVAKRLKGKKGAAGKGGGGVAKKGGGKGRKAR